VARAFIGLGSNLGDRLASLEDAIDALDWGDCRVVERSRVYETDPIGGPPDQPAFLNMVIEVETTLSPRALFERCQGVEVALGRARDPDVVWGPRAIDVDVLLYDDVVVAEPDLTIPHPRIAERAFVLVPLADIDANVTIPGIGTPAEALRSLGGADGVRALR
jgi:2-amino-4-hydroxy-6-hydroxymethyldihydropteridine diphosphokinase